MPRALPGPRLFPFMRIFCAALLSASLCSCQYLGKQRPENEIAQNPCLVLALPATGPYAQVAAKIRHGADLAVRELGQRGTQVRLENINTESQDWLARLASLPESCAVVGGPLRDKSYLEARKAGLLSQRAFFAFVPTLAKGDEGNIAWRYFPSPQDQVDSLISFATDKMGIRTYGAFYPSDNYGKRMTELMEQSLQKRNIPLQKAAYMTGSPATWRSAIAPLINPRRGEDGRTLVPQTTFEALFVPDSFKNMDMITNAMLVNGEDRLALLGTTLWEQGLAGKQVPKAEKYSLAVFPGAWNKSRAPANLKNGDFWSALGYDFINFGTAIALARRLDSQYVTGRAQKAVQTGRAMAPLHYDEAGIAHQQMYLFQITPAGMTLLDEGRFRQARSAAASRAALRMQGLGHIDPDTGEAVQERNPGPIYEQERPVQQPAQEAGAAQEDAGAQSATLDVPDAASEPVQQRPVNYGQTHQQQPVQQAVQPAQTQEAPRKLPPAQGHGIMSDTPRPSYKLSLPVRQ